MALRSVLALSLLAACGGAPPTSSTSQLFAAVEGDGTVAVLDGASGRLLRTIDVSDSAQSPPVRFMTHNVQADADRTVWVTAMPLVDADASDEARADELIGIDRETFAIVARIKLSDHHVHAAHVVTWAGRAYVTLNAGDGVAVVDLAQREVLRTIPLPAGTGPHGARLTHDGRLLVVAGLGSSTIEVIDTGTDAVMSYPLPGQAVQVAVLPDDSAAFATLGNTRQVARLDLSSRALTVADLPADSQGPVQIYPMPDGRSLWVADQGDPEAGKPGSSLYEIDAQSGQPLRTVAVAPGPHGVVVSGDGKRVFTTTVVEGTVQAIDVARGVVVSTTVVGDEPNGISYFGLTGVQP